MSSRYVKQQVITELKKAPFRKFAIQLDESTDVIACAQLLVFVRYVMAKISRKISCSVIP